jgi:hypothetical protein
MTTHGPHLNLAKRKAQSATAFSTILSVSFLMLKCRYAGCRYFECHGAKFNKRSWVKLSCLNKNALFSLTRQVRLGRSNVLSLPLQLVFPGVGHPSKKENLYLFTPINWLKLTCSLRQLSFTKENAMIGQIKLVNTMSKVKHPSPT